MSSLSTNCLRPPFTVASCMKLSPRKSCTLYMALNPFHVTSSTRRPCCLHIAFTVTFKTHLEGSLSGVSLKTTSSPLIVILAGFRTSSILCKCSLTNLASLASVFVFNMSTRFLNFTHDCKATLTPAFLLSSDE